MDPIKITLEDAQKIVECKLGTPIRITSIEELSNLKTLSSKVMLLRSAEKHYLLKHSLSESSQRPIYAMNTLITQYNLLQHIQSQSPPPLPTPAIHALDISQSLVPYPYILLSTPSSSFSVPPTPLYLARKLLSEAQNLKLNLRLGSYLHQLHEVQNDWFGTPAQEKDGIWSWQEAFIFLLEELLSIVEEKEQELGLKLPMVDLRACLSRAIGFFLFDDVEVPSLVSLTSDEDSVFIDLPGSGHDNEEAQISTFLGWDHLLWGDPMMEGLLRNPSAAILEGYGDPLVVFPRQKTKRLWYALYASLLTVLEQRGNESKVANAKKAVAECVEQLKNAPCY